jgi:hypothetical protein
LVRVASVATTPMVVFSIGSDWPLWRSAEAPRGSDGQPRLAGVLDGEADRLRRGESGGGEQQDRRGGEAGHRRFR